MLISNKEKLRRKRGRSFAREEDRHKAWPFAGVAHWTGINRAERGAASLPGLLEQLCISVPTTRFWLSILSTIIRSQLIVGHELNLAILTDVNGCLLLDALTARCHRPTSSRLNCMVRITGKTPSVVVTRESNIVVRSIAQQDNTGSRPRHKQQRSSGGGNACSTSAASVELLEAVARLNDRVAEEWLK
jgi:hypothetical protein